MSQPTQIKIFYEDRDREPRHHTCTIEIPEANNKGIISIKIQNVQLENGLKPVTVTVSDKELANRVKARLQSNGFKREDSYDPNTWDMVFSNQADLNRMLVALAVTGTSGNLAARPIITPAASDEAIKIAETVFPKGILPSLSSWHARVTASRSGSGLPNL